MTMQENRIPLKPHKSHENVRKKIKTTAKFSHRSTEKTEKLYVKKKKKKKKKNGDFLFFTTKCTLCLQMTNKRASCSFLL